MIDEFSNVLGIIGVVMILIAYALLQVRKIDPLAIPFSSMNFFGSILIFISLMVHWNLASVVIEAAWIIISGYGLTKASKSHYKKKIYY